MAAHLFSFARVWSVFAALLLAATWRLWTPQAVFPQVPFLQIFGALPAAAVWICLAVVWTSLLLVLVSRPSSVRFRGALGAFAAAMTLLILADQHRFQPWAYQFILIAIVMAACSDKQAWPLLRWLTISIYFFSAVSKFDYTFLHTLGPSMVAALGVPLDDSPAWARAAAALLLPIGELAVAAGLAIPSTRRPAMIAAVVMHLVLICSLGPWGLNHKPGVLIWNGWFIVQAIFLFSGAEPKSQPADDRKSGKAAMAVIALAIALPILELFNAFDHWPAWSLYSPRASRAEVFIHRYALHRLPQPVRHFIVDAPDNEDWLRLRIDRWSLEATSAPIYPQARFHVGVAEALGRRYDLRSFIRVELLSPASRVGGSRERESAIGLSQIEQLQERFWINAAAARI